MITEAQMAVRQFNETFNLPISEKPVILERSRVLLRAKWMKEEIDEFISATDIAEQVDAIVDLIYFALGVFVEMGIDGGEAFRIVHQANMAKAGQNSELAYDEDGKVTKPTGWVSPNESIRRWLNGNDEN